MHAIQSDQSEAGMRFEKCYDDRRQRPKGQKVSYQGQGSVRWLGHERHGEAWVQLPGLRLLKIQCYVHTHRHSQQRRGQSQHPKIRCPYELHYVLPKPAAGPATKGLILGAGALDVLACEFHKYTMSVPTKRYLIAISQLTSWPLLISSENSRSKMTRKVFVGTYGRLTPCFTAESIVKKIGPPGDNRVK